MTDFAELLEAPGVGLPAVFLVIVLLAVAGIAQAVERFQQYRNTPRCWAKEVALSMKHEPQRWKSSAYSGLAERDDGIKIHYGPCVSMEAPVSGIRANKRQERLLIKAKNQMKAKRALDAVMRAKACDKDQT